MIRKAIPSEIDTLLSITKACAAKMISEGIFQWNDHYPNALAFKKDIARDELFVLIDQERIIGCLAISSKKDEEYNAIEWLTEDQNNFYIHRLAIHPDSQNRGLARKAMDFAERYAKAENAVSIRLDTFSKNLRNQRFYEARGYIRLGEIYFPKQSEHPFYCYELPLAKSSSS
jgi:ribosomal protein S18 acetylase RimI-like enzyme